MILDRLWGMESAEPAVSTRIVRRVAKATNRNETELPLLYDAIDPEALDTLIARMSDGEISFDYAECRITVRGDETIRIEAPSAINTATRASVHTD